MDMPSHGGAHLWTAVAYYIIGFSMLAAAFSVWWTHPINRVFIFGRFLTPDGMRLVMMSWPMVALFGAFIFSCAVDHHVEYFYSHGNPELLNAVVFFSIVEAVISCLTAGIILWLGGRALVRLLWRK